MNWARPFDDCIADAGVQVEVIRFLSSPIVKGRVQQAPVEKRFCITASIQPLSTKSEREEMRLLPEGLLRSGVRQLFTATELLIAEQSECKTADRVLYRGGVFQVHTIDDWFDLGGYFRHLIVRMGQ